MSKRLTESERLYILPRFKAYTDQSLWNFALDLANEGVRKRVWLGVWEHNEPAKAFYSHWSSKSVFSQHTFQ